MHLKRYSIQTTTHLKIESAFQEGNILSLYTGVQNFVIMYYDKRVIQFHHSTFIMKHLERI